MTAWRLEYTTALERLDAPAIVEALGDEVVIQVAVHDAPMRGRDIARFLFGVLSEELGALHVTDEIIEGSRAVLLFETSIGDHAAQGVNVLAYDDAGAIQRLTVFFRPLQSLQRIAEVIGSRMAARYGPSPK